MPTYLLQYNNAASGWEDVDPEVPSTGGDAEETIRNYLVKVVSCVGGMAGDYRYRDATDDQAPWLLMKLLEDGTAVPSPSVG